MLLKKTYNNKTDEELMSLLTKREQLAFDELYNRYSKPLLNFFFRMLNYDRAKAEDLLHDLFLKIIENPESFDTSLKFSTWFYTLAGNMIKNEYRKQQIRIDYAGDIKTGNYQAIENNGESLDKNIFNRRLETELDKLDPETKIMFNLRFKEEMSIKEIAGILNCPEGTIKSRLFYLTKNLSVRMAAFKPEKI
jgi:RNA polymerase sigma-70 factor (ECF subfamily)